MSRYRKDKFRGHAEPVRVDRPLLVRLCEAFVENLGLILRIGLVVGGIALVQDLDALLDLSVTTRSETPPGQVAADEPSAPPEETMDEDSALTPGVQHALNCTYTEYRNEHYDECVKEPSEVYKRPEAGPDDIGFVDYEEVVLYASLTHGPASAEKASP